MLIHFIDNMTGVPIARRDWPQVPADKEAVTLAHLGTFTVVERNWKDDKFSPGELVVYLHVT